MKLSTWAKNQGIHYHTAWTWFKHGKLPVKAKQLPSGAIIIEESNSANKKSEAILLCEKLLVALKNEN
jgi:putative resolvase